LGHGEEERVGPHNLRRHPGEGIAKEAHREMLEIDKREDQEDWQQREREEYGGK